MIETIFLWLFYRILFRLDTCMQAAKMDLNNSYSKFIRGLMYHHPRLSLHVFFLCFFTDTVGFSKIRNSILLLNAIYHVIRLNCVPSLFDVTTTFASGTTGRLRRAIRSAGPSFQRSPVYGGVVSSSDDSPNETPTSVFKFQAK